MIKDTVKRYQRVLVWPSEAIKKEKKEGEINVPIYTSGTASLI
jgi:hypothetical protein